MKTLRFEEKDEWMISRRGRITGSRLKDIVTLKGNGRKIGFYELISERLGIEADDENVMERGIRLEEEAVEMFAQETKKKVDTSLILWTRDDDENIAISPDGFIGKKEAIEVKCLSSARHIEAFLTQKVPSEYEAQAYQYFIVNDNLEILYMVFYDPRLIAKPFFYLTIKRKDIEDEITFYLDSERALLKEVKDAVLKLSF